MKADNFFQYAGFTRRRNSWNKEHNMTIMTIMNLRGETLSYPKKGTLRALRDTFALCANFDLFLLFRLSWMVLLQGLFQWPKNYSAEKNTCARTLKLKASCCVSLTGQNPPWPAEHAALPRSPRPLHVRPSQRPGSAMIQKRRPSSNHHILRLS